MAETADNVDPQEIRKFAALASRWWDPHSEFKPLHDINPLRLNYIDQHSPLNGQRVLDVGCGGGLLSEAMALRGADVTGIDMGEAPLAVARLHAEQSGASVRYLHRTAEAMSDAEAGSYDIVTCLEMLEHVPDPAAVVTACAQLVKPGGQVYFSTLNRTPKSFLFAIVGAEYVLRLLPRGTHEYAKFIRPSELESWIRASGLSLRDLTGMHYNPVLRYYWLGPGVGVNYMVRCSRDD